MAYEMFVSIPRFLESYGLETFESSGWTANLHFVQLTIEKTTTLRVAEQVNDHCLARFCKVVAVLNDTPRARNWVPILSERMAQIA